MVGFLFAINTFAWFVFMTNGESNIDANVISWDIAFINEESQVELISIDINDLYPGMPDFEHRVTVKNRSDLDATFSYEVQEIIAFGDSYTNPNLIEMLENELPFSISFEYDSDVINKGENIDFLVKVTWPYESQKAYYKLNELYSYVNGCNYYQYDAEQDEYTLANVNGTRFANMVQNGLYVESDDADTFWGEQSIPFKEQYPDDGVLTLKVKLIVTQKQS